MTKQQNKEKLNKYTRFGRSMRWLVITLCVISSLGYALSPMIIEQTIRFNLPENVLLKNFEADFPGFSQIGISELAFDIGGNLVRLHNLRSSYDLKDVSLQSLSIKLADGNTGSGDLSSGLFSRKRLNLPNIKLAKLTNLNRLKQISIGQIDLVSKHQHMTFGNTQFIKKNKNDFQIITRKLAGDGVGKLESLPITLSLLTDSSTNLDINVSADGSQLVSISYLTEHHQTELKLQLSTFSLLNKLELLNKVIPFSDESSLELDWSSDLSHEQLVLELNARLYLLQPMLDSLAVKTASGAKDILPIITNMKLTAIQQQALIVSGFIDTKNSFDLMFNSEFLKIQKVHLNFETSISEELFNTSDIILLHPKTKLAIEGLSVAPVEGLAAELKKISIESTSEQISLKMSTENNARFYFLSMLGDTFSLNNDLEIGEISGSFVQTERDIHEIINFSSAVKGQFMISNAKERSVATSGHLSFQNLVLNKVDYYIESTLDFLWNNIDQSLSSGTIQTSLISENAIIDNVSIDSFSSEAEFSLAENKISGSGNMVLNDKIISPFLLSYDKRNANLSAQFKNNKLDPQILNPFLSAFGKKNKLELNILSGVSQQSTALSFNDALALTSSLLIEDMLFSFGENTINGLDIKQQITSINPLKFNLDLSIDEVNFTSGLLISNIKSDITSVSSDSIKINNLSAEIFEGTLSFDGIEVEKNVVQPSLMKLSSISLTELIFFMDVAGLYAEGLLDLDLPLALNGGNLIVENGTFATQKPGILKYSGGELKPGDDENVGLTALRNFHYQSLDGNLSYDEKGYYRIKLHLLGSNPDLYDGYPIDFVVNLNGELSGIFRSLFLTGSFEEAVMEQVKAGQVDNSPE